MVQPGMINLDFSDIKTVMSEMGKAMMGTGEASGEGRAVAAAEAAIANPLIDDVSLKGAKGLIINITGGKDITLYEVDEAANRIKQEVDDEANIIYGTTCDDRLDGLVRVSIVATGIDSNISINAKPLENFSSININNDIYKSNEINEDQKTEIPVFVKDQIDHDIDEDINEEETLLNSLDTIEEQNSHISDNSLEISKDSFTNTNSFKITESEERIEEYLESEESVLNDDLNTDSVEEKDEINESDIPSNETEDISEEQTELPSVEEPSVRRLSLFDNISSNISEKSPDESEKTEPVISEKVFETEKIETSDTIELNENREEPSFNASNDDLDEEFNQETEEELLDIPTFLRRQAN
jgi:cell division protein FtsZ